MTKILYKNYRLARAQGLFPIISEIIRGGTMKVHEMNMYLKMSNHKVFTSRPNDIKYGVKVRGRPKSIYEGVMYPCKPFIFDKQIMIED